MNDTTITPATFSDIEFLWYIRNQKDAYEFPKHPNPAVKLEEHINWIIPVLLHIAGKDLFVVRYGDVPVGQVRFDYEEDRKALISIAIVKEFRGKGIASVALEQAIQYIAKKGLVAILVAEIHKENAASIRLFEKLHFVYTSEDQTYFRYELAL